MKLFTILGLIAMSVSAMAQEYEGYYGQNEPKAREAWNNYLVDYCSEPVIDSELSSAKGKLCRDGSVSYIQPESRGAGGYEGKCGHTLAANMIYTICSQVTAPSGHWESQLGDITPGVRPRTLSSGLNRAFSTFRSNCPYGDTRAYTIKLGNAKNFVSKVSAYLKPIYNSPNVREVYRNGERRLRNPVGVLLKNPESQAHWVMVIDETQKNGKCHYIVNHWSRQFEIPCETLAKWSGDLQIYGIFLRPYQVVTFK